MRRKARKGNLLIAVVIFFLVITTMASMLSVNVAQKNSARAKAQSAGNANSYISLANVCAWAFKDDLEAQAMTMVIANITNPSGENGIDAFDEAAATFQTTLNKDPSAIPTVAPWTHMLSNPYDAIEFAGLTDTESMQYIEGLLAGASVTITVDTTLAVLNEEGDNLAIKDGAVGTLADIYFHVELKKGTWKVSQTYCLTGEKICLRLVGAQAGFSIDGTRAECKLLKQTVSQNHELNSN